MKGVWAKYSIGYFYSNPVYSEWIATTMSGAYGFPMGGFSSSNGFYESGTWGGISPPTAPSGIWYNTTDVTYLAENPQSLVGDHYVGIKQTGTCTKNEKAGTFIENVIAAEGTYPDNGVSGGYWYTKIYVTDELFAKIDGIWKLTSPSAFVGGIVRPLYSRVKVNGIWR